MQSFSDYRHADQKHCIQFSLWFFLTYSPYSAREELAVINEDVGQTLDVAKLVVYQVEADNGHGFLDALVVLLQHFGIRVGNWSLLRSVYNVPKIHEIQNHLYFELPKAKSLTVKLVDDSSIFTIKIVIFRSKNAFAHSNPVN
jgi:hypothetical protein